MATRLTALERELLGYGKQSKTKRWRKGRKRKSSKKKEQQPKEIFI